MICHATSGRQQIIPKTINTILYASVFLIISQISPVEKRNLKLSSPTHSLVRKLFKNPPLILNFLKAITIPNIGIKQNRKYQIVFCKASRVSSVSSLLQRLFFLFTFFISPAILHPPFTSLPRILY